MADFDLAALARAVDRRREAEGLTWAAATREINRHIGGAGRVAISTITGLGTRPSAEGDGVLQLLLWLGRSPESFVAGVVDAPRFRLPVPPIGRTLRWDTAALHAALDAERRRSGASWSSLAREIDVPPGVLTGLARGGRASLPAAMRIVIRLERPAASFTRFADG